MDWRLVTSQEFSAYKNMAIDQAISEKVRNGEMKPTLRFYHWNPSAVSIGYFQKIREEVDIDRCNELDVDFVRRRTGGGAVYHDRKGELTYSVIAPKEMFADDIIESYEEICGWIIETLKQEGVEAEFKPVNDIVVNGKKISGNAQTRRDGILLQHGTIIHELNAEKMFQTLKIGPDKISDKVIQKAEDRVCAVTDRLEISRDELEQKLIDQWSFGDLEKGDYTEDELERAEELAKEKYNTEDWNFQR